MMKLVKYSKESNIFKMPKENLKLNLNPLNIKGTLNH